MAKLFFQCLAIFEAENFLIIVNLFAKVGCQFSPKFLHHPLNYCRWLSVSCHSGEISPNPVTLDVYQVMKKEVVVVVAVHMHIWMVFGACRLPRTPWAGPTSHSECQVEGLKGPERNGGERKIIAFEGLNVSLSQIFLSLPHSLSLSLIDTNTFHRTFSLSHSPSLPPSLSFFLLLSLSICLPLLISLSVSHSLSFFLFPSLYLSHYLFLSLIYTKTLFCVCLSLLLFEVMSYIPSHLNQHNLSLSPFHTMIHPHFLRAPFHPSKTFTFSLSLSLSHTHTLFLFQCVSFFITLSAT